MRVRTSLLLTAVAFVVFALALGRAEKTVGQCRSSEVKSFFGVPEEFATMCDSSIPGDGGDGNREWLLLYSHQSDGPLAEPGQVDANTDNTSAPLYSIMSVLTTDEGREDVFAKADYLEFLMEWGVGENDEAPEPQIWAQNMLADEVQVEYQDQGQDQGRHRAIVPINTPNFEGGFDGLHRRIPPLGGNGARATFDASSGSGAYAVMPSSSYFGSLHGPGRTVQSARLWARPGLCDATCATCIGPDPSHCLSCADDSLAVVGGACLPPPLYPPTLGSCAAVKAAAPDAGSGTYGLLVNGDYLAVYCDMDDVTSAAGDQKYGWTRVLLHDLTRADVWAQPDQRDAQAFSGDPNQPFYSIMSYINALRDGRYAAEFRARYTRTAVADSPVEELTWTQGPVSWDDPGHVRVLSPAVAGPEFAGLHLTRKSGATYLAGAAPGNAFPFMQQQRPGGLTGPPGIDGTFDKLELFVRGVECHRSCSLCSGPEADACLTCAPGLRLLGSACTEPDAAVPAFSSCQAALAWSSNAPDGAYDISTPLSAALPVVCDMSGGGWTRVYRQVADAGLASSGQVDAHRNDPQSGLYSILGEVEAVAGEGNALEFRLEYPARSGFGPTTWLQRGAPGSTTGTPAGFKALSVPAGAAYFNGLHLASDSQGATFDCSTRDSSRFAVMQSTPFLGRLNGPTSAVNAVELWVRGYSGAYSTTTAPSTASTATAEGSGENDEGERGAVGRDCNAHYQCSDDTYCRVGALVCAPCAECLVRLDPTGPICPLKCFDNAVTISPSTTTAAKFRTSTSTSTTSGVSTAQSDDGGSGDNGSGGGEGGSGELDCASMCESSGDNGPVCSDGTTYPSTCFARCNGHTLWVKGPCGTSITSSAPTVITTSTTTFPDLSCSTCRDDVIRYEPVCADGERDFSSPCAAVCAGMATADLAYGTCASLASTTSTTAPTTTTMSDGHGKSSTTTAPLLLTPPTTKSTAGGSTTKTTTGSGGGTVSTTGGGSPSAAEATTGSPAGPTTTNDALIGGVVGGVVAVVLLLGATVAGYRYYRSGQSGFYLVDEEANPENVVPDEADTGLLAADELAYDGGMEPFHSSGAQQSSFSATGQGESAAAPPSSFF